jgi:hypothetical protein
MQSARPFKTKLRLKQPDANGRLRTVWGSHDERIFTSYAEMETYAKTMLRGAPSGTRVYNEYGALIAKKGA